jgi:hypothetical protein
MDILLQEGILCFVKFWLFIGLVIKSYRFISSIDIIFVLFDFFWWALSFQWGQPSFEGIIKMGLH